MCHCGVPVHGSGPCPAGFKCSFDRSHEFQGGCYKEIVASCNRAAVWLSTATMFCIVNLKVCDGDATAVNEQVNRMYFVCVRLVQARFASTRSCVRNMSLSKLVASLSCFLPGCRVSRTTFASPPASTRASGCSSLACVRALDHASQYVIQADVDLLFECTGPYHAPTIMEVLGR